MMKRRIILILIIVLLLSVLGASLLYITFQNNRNQISCDSCAYINSPSFSRQYMLEIMSITVNDQNYNYFQIRDTSISYDSKNYPNGNVVYVSEEKFRTTDTLYFLWDDEGRIWVYSGDVGTFFWVRGSDADWNKFVYVDEEVKAPYFLKEIRPQYHQK